MKSKLKLPRVAETVDEVVVMEWLIEPGDVISEGQPILRVETDKALVEVEAALGGTVVELLVSVEDEISTGDAIATIEWN